MCWIDELADLIVEGRNKEAYSLLRDRYSGLPLYESRVRILAERAKPDRGPFPTDAEIDAHHNRAEAQEPPPAKVPFQRPNDLPAKAGFQSQKPRKAML